MDGLAESKQRRSESRNAGEPRLAPSGPTGRRGTLLVLLFLVLALAAGALGWCRWVYLQIQSYSVHDQAAPSDAIVVFGAAEYDGRPSPVYRARLEHALVLYEHAIAPLIVTLGGNGGDQYSEGEVGEDYLESRGIPEEAIIAETESHTTEDSARRVAVIAKANNLRRLVIVSDGTHLFRIHEICAADGLNVLTSPRPRSAVEGKAPQMERIWHEIVAYTLWRMHLD